MYAEATSWQHWPEGEPVVLFGAEETYGRHFENSTNSSEQLPGAASGLGGGGEAVPFTGGEDVDFAPATVTARIRAAMNWSLVVISEAAVFCLR